MKYILIQIIALLFLTRLNAQVELVYIKGVNFQGNYLKNYPKDSKYYKTYIATDEDINKLESEFESFVRNDSVESFDARINHIKNNSNKYFRQYYSYSFRSQRFIQIYYYFIDEKNGYKLSDIIQRKDNIFFHDSLPYNWVVCKGGCWSYFNIIYSVDKNSFDGLLEHKIFKSLKPYKISKSQPTVLVPISGKNFQGNFLKNYSGVMPLYYIQNGKKYNATKNEILKLEAKIDTTELLKTVNPNFHFKNNKEKYFRQYYSYRQGREKIIEIYFSLIDFEGKSLDQLRRQKWITLCDDGCFGYYHMKYYIKTNKLIDLQEYLNGHF